MSPKVKEYAAEGGTALVDPDANLTPITFLGSSGGEMQVMETHFIVASLTNPRKNFDPVALSELAESIKAMGVVQPILIRLLPPHRLQDTFEVRPKGSPLPTHEVVAGERRLRAAIMAGVRFIPVLIRELSDDAALEIQIIENLHRSDLSTFEEAEGFAHLMQHSALTAKQVGEKIKKSKEFVYARLKLLDLFQAGRQALREGKLDTSKALLLARIPNEELQNKALKEISEKAWSGAEPMSYVRAAEHVQRNYMLKLDQARFKITDATLVPEAGSCRECPKRTGHAPDLFQDVKGADVCTDPKCFHSKEQAQTDKQMREAHERGQTIIEGREAKALMPNSYSGVEGYLRLDDSQDSPTDKPLRKLLGNELEKSGVQPTLIANPHKGGELIAVLPADQVAALLKAKGQAAAAEKINNEASRADEMKAIAEKQEAKRNYESKWRWNLLEAAWTQRHNFDDPKAELARYLALQYASGTNQEIAKRLCKVLDLGKVAPQEALKQYIKDTDHPEHALLLLVMQRDVEYRHWMAEQNPGLLLCAKLCGVDALPVKSKTKADLRAAMPKKAPAAEVAKPDLPLPSAALAVDSRAKQKKSNTHAAPAGDSPPRKRKATAQETKEGIAHALQGLEAAAATAAGSTDTAQTPANADKETTPGSAKALQGDEASAPADAGTPSVAPWPFPTEPAPPPPPQSTPAPGATAAPADKFDNSAWPYPKEDPGAAGQTALVRAKALVIREKKATVRLLKAELGIGTTLAMGIMTELESLGVVSACDERGARKVLVA